MNYSDLSKEEQEAIQQLIKEEADKMSAWHNPWRKESILYLIHRVSVALNHLDCFIKLSELGFLQEIGIDNPADYVGLAGSSWRITVDSGWQSKIDWKNQELADLYRK